MSEQHQHSYTIPEHDATAGYAPTYEGPLPDGDWYGPPQIKWQDDEDLRQISRGKEATLSVMAIWSQWKTRAKYLFFLVAFLVITLLLFVPVWNCIALLNDPVYTYLSGDSQAAILLTFCILLYITSLATIWMLLKRPTPEVKTERTLLLVAGIFLSCLGVILILLGVPMYSAARKADTDLTHRCKSGPLSKPLYLTFKDLGTLRATPSCAKLPSVEQCPGFLDYLNTDDNFRLASVAKHMENSYSCSGFCEGLDSKGKQIYPPTLFSDADYKTSCDGMSARHMRNFVEDISVQTVLEGTILVSVAILISFGKLLGFLAWPKHKDFKAKADDNYGATA